MVELISQKNGRATDTDIASGRHSETGAQRGSTHRDTWSAAAAARNEEIIDLASTDGHAANHLLSVR